MTKRDYFNELRDLVTNSDVQNGGQLLAFINHELELLDKKNAASAKSAKRKDKAKDELAVSVFSALTAEPQTVVEILEKISDEGATPSKLSYRLSKMVEAGTAVREMVKDSETPRRVTAYRLVTE